MSGENINASKQEPRFKWEVNRSSEHGVFIYLRDEIDKKIVGEFSFSIRQMKKLDSAIYGYHTSDPFPYPFPDHLNHLRTIDEEWAKTAVKAFETMPSTIAHINMWKINDAVRGNLSVIRQMFRIAMPEFRKYNAEYMVGSYVPQIEEGLSVAPYAAEMYHRMAQETGGAVHGDGKVWISVDGLAKWLKI